MAIKSTKTVTDSTLRNEVFTRLDIANIEGFQRINDRQYGILLTDVNGVERYVRVGANVSELREDVTARELMASEIQAYAEKQVKKELAAEAKKEKIALDKKRREEKKKEG